MSTQANIDPTHPTVASRQIASLDFEFAKADVIERLRFQASFAEAAWKALTLVNGGAIVALFTFIGNTKPTVNQFEVWVGFVSFAIGLTSNIVSIVSGFLAQAYFMKCTTSGAWNKQLEMHGYAPAYVDQEQREFRFGNIWEAIAIAACVASLICFVLGSGFSLSAVSVAAHS